MSALRMIINRINEHQENIRSWKTAIEGYTKSIVRSQGIIFEFECIVKKLRNEIDMKPFMELVHEGKKISAIKQYREDSGLGLKEAKDKIEQCYAEYQDRTVSYHVDSSSSLLHILGHGAE